MRPQTVCSTWRSWYVGQLNLIWWHSKGYSWLVGLRVVRRELSQMSPLRCSKDASGCASFFDQVWRTRMSCCHTFLHCVGAMWVGLRSAVERCAAFVSLCLGGAQFARISFFKCGTGPKVFTLTHRLHFEIHHDVFAAMGPASTDLRGEVSMENDQDECTSEHLMVVCLIVLLVFLCR